MVEPRDETNHEQRRGSFLVRVWQEVPRSEGAEPVVRVYLRDLGSGEEQYLRPADLGMEILCRLSFGKSRQAFSEEDKTAAI